MNIDTIKQYLVGLGFSVNNSEFDKIKGVLGDLDKKVEGVTGSISKDFTVAATGIVAAITTISSATIALMNNVAQSDLGYKLFAMKMYMGEDAAKKFKIATDALGHSIEEIAWNPELRKRYFELIGMETGMQNKLPSDSQSQLKYIRDINFEWTKFKVEMKYGEQWLTYNLFKALGLDIKTVHEKLKEWNDYIQRNLPEITRQISEYLSPVLDVFKQFIGLIPKASRVLEDFFKIAGGGDASTGFQRWIWLISSMAKWLSTAAGAAIDLVDAMALLFGGKYKESSDRMHGIWKDIKNTQQGISGKWNDIGNKQSGMISYEEWQKKSSASGGNSSIMAAAQNVSKKTGVPTEYIYGQWYHETGGFKNRGATELNNFAGVKNPGGVGYRNFGSIDEFSDYFAGLLTRKYKNALSAKSPEEYAQALKQGGYYEDNSSNYINGLRRGIKNFQSRYQDSRQMTSPVDSGSNTTNNSEIGDVTINIMQPNATPEQIKNAVMVAMADKKAKSTARQIREFSGVYA